MNRQHHTSWYLALISGTLLLLTACAGASTAPAPQREQTQSPATPTAQASPTVSAASAVPSTTVPTTPPAAATATTPAAANPPGFAENPQWQMTLNTIERPGKILEWSALPGKVEAKGELLVVSLTIHKTKEGSADIGLNDFELFTDDVVYKPLNCCRDYALSKAIRPLDFATSFGPDQVSQIVLVFDVPLGLGNATLSFISGVGLNWQIR